MPLLVLAQQAASASDDASGRLSMVITALVVLAVLIAVATVVFWRLTRPEPVEPAMRWSAPAAATAPAATAPVATAPAADVATPISNAAAPVAAAAAVEAPAPTPATTPAASSGAVTAPRSEVGAEQPRAAG